MLEEWLSRAILPSTMHFQDLQSLFKYGESDWLDYKAQLGPGIEHPNASKDQRTHDQGKLLKDLMCLANSPSPELRRYLIRGVKDQKSQRHIVGVLQSLDDADVQGWLQGRFDPPLRVQYWQWPLEDGHYVGVFEVSVTPGVAHVPTQSHGSLLIKGQVWWRAGSENQLPGATGLRQIFGPPRPFPLVGWRQGDRLVDQLDLQTWVHGLQQRARADCRIKIQQAANNLREVAARPRPTMIPPLDIQVLNKVSPAVSARMDEEKAQKLLDTLEKWGVHLSSNLLQPPDLWSTRTSIWPNALNNLTVGVEGAGTEWYEALSNLVSVVDSFSPEWYRLQQLGERPNLVVEVQNLGSAPLGAGLLRLTPLEGGQFKFGPLSRLPLSPKVGEVRPGPGGTADIVLGDLPPQSRLSIQLASLQRQLSQRTLLRAEVSGNDLPQVVLKTLILG